jgi:hypothetical protein
MRYVKEALPLNLPLKQYQELSLPVLHTQRQRHAVRLLYLHPQAQHTLCVLDNLVSTKLALAVQPVHKRDGHLRNRASHGLGAHHHLHLERVALALCLLDDPLQHFLLVQPKATSEITHTRPQHCVGEQIRASAHKLPLQVPAIHAAVASISRTRDDVVVLLLLHTNHVGNEFGVVREVGVHDDNIVSCRELQAVDVGGSESQLACAGADLDLLGGVCFLELCGYFLGSVGRAIVDDYELPVKVAKNDMLVFVKWWWAGMSLWRTSR